MKKNLMNKTSLKILSLIIAFFTWLIVMNIEDPVIETVYYDIPVTIVNSSYLESESRVPVLRDDGNTVNVGIRAKASVIDDLEKRDITAEADVTQIISMETDPIMVPVKVSCPDIDAEDITVTPGNIPIDVEEKISTEQTIYTTYGDTLPDKNYEVGSAKAEPQVVSISGPASTINKIDRVVARIDVTNMAEDALEEAELQIYDKNQEEFTEKQMASLNLEGIKDNKVKVRVDLWRVQTNVKVVAEYSGEPEYGYEVVGVSSTPDTISIAGTDEALKSFAQSGNVLQIPGNLVDVTGQSQDYTASADLSELLPEGIKLARNISSTASVTAKILPYNSKEFEIPTNSIKTIPEKLENYDVIFEKEKVAVRVKGKDADLDRLKAEDIQLSVDLQNYKEGESEVPVQVTLPDGYEQVDEITVSVRLVQAAETSKKTEDTENRK